MPKVLVKPGDRVLIGTPLMCDKNRPEMLFVSPVSGEVEAVNRGERRKVLNITVKSDGKMEHSCTTRPEISTLDGQQVKAVLLERGLFMYIKQRPYDIIADPTVFPRDIFVTAWDSAPLAPDFDFVVKGREDDLQAGIDVLAKLTAGRVYLGVRAGSRLTVRGAEVVAFDGRTLPETWGCRFTTLRRSPKVRPCGRSALSTCWL